MNQIRSSALHPCDHCRLPFPATQSLREVVDDQERLFCCHGCRGAFLIITGAGLDRFYRQRSWQAAGVPEGAFEARHDDDYLQRFVHRDADGFAELTCIIEGIHCASCVWLIEKIVSRLPGVTAARVHFGTHRARVRFDPTHTTAAELFAAISRIGYRPRAFTADQTRLAAERENRSLLIRFGTAFFLSMQLMGFSLALYAGYFQGMEARFKDFMHVFSALVTTPVVFYGGYPFLQGAWRSLRNGAPGMDLLVSTGILAAYGISLYATLAGGEVYFDTAAMLVTLLLAGRLLENAARRRAAAGVDRLLQLAPDQARRLEGGHFVSVATALLRPGDLLSVHPGERFPVDGRLSEGETEIDEAVVTGEAMPVLRRSGEPITAGTLNLRAAVTITATAGAADSFIARIARLVEEAQSRQAPVQALADRIAGRFVPAVAVIAAGTWLFWTLQPPQGTSPLLAAIAVLVIACPCALGLATPMAMMVGCGAAANRGILFRGGDVLEKLARVKVIALDKTGTLTLGRPQVVAVHPTSGTEDELLLLAAQAESGSSHPLARGIADEVQRRALPQSPLNATARAWPGRGLELLVQSGPLLVGNRAFLRERGVQIEAGGSTATEVHVALSEHYCGAILLEDLPRPESAAVIAQLHTLGLGTALLSGDRLPVAQRLAAQVQLQQVHGELTPQQKADWIERVRHDGTTLVMVGDGINDAPALAAADVGCTLSGGTDIALETADLILTRPDLSLLPKALLLARRTMAVVRQNLFWAFAYNLLALPLAAAGQLTPIHAAVAMALSSLCVLGNSLRLADGKES
jgi:P-type Cu2+ transporter